jgi:hypothetical protein
MTPERFRALALRLPEAVEQSHMCHPDFRVGGKIFASLWVDLAHAMVKLTPTEQAEFVRAMPGIFRPVKGAWGARGCTQVTLKGATKSQIWPALMAAWKNVAPQQLVEAWED